MINKEYIILQESVMLYEFQLQNRIKKLFDLSTNLKRSHVPIKKLDKFPDSFDEKINNFFGSYTKYSFQECVDLYKKQLKQFHEALDYNWRVYKQDYIEGNIEEFNIPANKIKQHEKDIYQLFITYYTCDFIAIISEKFINHCDDEKKMYQYLIKEYEKYNDLNFKIQRKLDSKYKKK